VAEIISGNSAGIISKQVLLGLADWKNCEGGTLTVENRMKLHIPDQETWKKWKEDPLKKKGVICTDSTILQSQKLYKACRLLQKKMQRNISLLAYQSLLQ
jgi:hypothetical protein